jgi:hypothetical protein
LSGIERSLDAWLRLSQHGNQQLRIAPFLDLLAVSASRRMVEPSRTHLADQRQIVSGLTSKIRRQEK